MAYGDVPAGGADHTQVHRDIAAALDASGGSGLTGTDGGPGEDGGSITVSGGYGNDFGSSPGQVIAAGGTASGNGGSVSLSSGSGAVGGSGGDVELVGGTGDDGNTAGASVRAEGGSGDGVTQGNVFASAGSGGVAQAGGHVTLTGGGGDDGNDPGASIVVGGGDGAGNPGHVEVTGDLWVGTITGAGDVSIVSSGVALLASDPAYIQASGSDVSMGGVLTQEVGGIFVKHMGGTADPSAGAGVAASVASLYPRDNGGVGELWVKTGSGDTDWTKVV